MILQGLSFVALAVRTAGKTVTQRRAGTWMAFSFSVFGLGSFEADAQEQPGKVSPFQSDISISTEHMSRIESPPEKSKLSDQLREELLDQFDRRSMQFYFLNEYSRNQDPAQMGERFGNSARRRVERGITRTITHALERTPLISSLKDGGWKEALLDLTTDSVTEETPTIGSPIGEDDPHVDYDVEAPVVRKPAWKRNVNFFVRPFSMHPNVGVGVKLDAVRAQVKAYHDEVKFSAFLPITENWNFYSSARMSYSTPDEANISFGFQHEIRLLPGPAPAIVQYGVALKNREWTDNGRNYREHLCPHAFLAIAYDF